MKFKDKADSLAAKMNAITASLDIADEMIIEGDDIIEMVESKTNIIELSDPEKVTDLDLLNAEVMLEDFIYVRRTLKEATENTRRILNTVTLDLLSADDETKSILIVSFTELNKSLVLAQDLFLKSYKEMSNILVNVEKVKQAGVPEQIKSVTNNLTLNATENVSTVELIKQLRELKEK